ncbi:MAG: class I SAM-dependent methyltransferase [Deltaproteobacteria bacterium]|nr:class I SAM-dependent methyltransferase [Deltaproteobacteria bacterium]
MVDPARSANERKHLSRNPLMQRLVGGFYARLLELLDELPFESLLDAGCGEGFSLVRLAARYPRARLVGVDAADRALRHAVFPAGVGRARADLLQLPFADRSVDLVLATEVLEHLPVPRAGLRELLRVSRRYVVVTVPHEPYFRLANLARGKNVRAFGNDPGHIQHWSRRGFVEFVAADCTVLRTAGAFPWTLVVAVRR